jgi:signal peptidase
MAWIKNIGGWFVSLLVVIMAASLIFSSLNSQNDEGISIFGVSGYVVLSDSMVPIFASGDVIIIQAVPPESLVSGDIITFRSRDPLTFGEIISHEIHEVINVEDTFTFITKGVNLNTIDNTPVSSAEIIGKYWFRIPYIGFVINFSRTLWGFILLFVTPMLVLIGFELSRFLYHYQKHLRQKILANLGEKNISQPSLTEDERYQTMQKELQKIREENERLKKKPK